MTVELESLAVHEESTVAPATRVVQHRSHVGAWDLVLRQPAPALRPYVHEYQGYVENPTTARIRRRELAWPGVVLIVNFGPAFRVIDPRSPYPGDYGSFVAGLYDSYVLVESTGPSNCLQVNFTPVGARLFFGLPMDEIANRIVELEDLLAPDGKRLTDELWEAGTWDARFERLEAFIAARLDRAPPASPAVQWAWQRLVANAGAVRPGALAHELGWSQKHLIARCREQIGLPPRTLARIVRFDRAVGLLDRRPTRRLAEVAQLAGYYDQAHFNRDFRELGGSSPGDFLRRRLADGGGVIDG